MPVPGLRVHGRENPVRGDSPGDPEYPGRVLLQVLAGHAGQQLRGLRQHRIRLLPLQRRQQRAGIFGQHADQLLPGGRVVVVTGRLAGGRVIIIAAQHRAQLAGQVTASGLQHPADRRADQRDRVHRGNRVIQRRGIQHPPPPHQPGRPGHLHGHLEDPVRPRRPGQPGPHVHQHRVHKPRVIEIQPPGRVLPPGIEREPVHRLPVTAALGPLQHHHHRHDHRRHRPAAHIIKQVSEHLIREQGVTLPVQDPVDRVRRHPPITERRRATEQISLPRCQAQRHQPLRERNLQLQQFSRNDQRTWRTATREKHQLPRACPIDHSACCAPTGRAPR